MLEIIEYLCFRFNTKLKKHAFGLTFRAFDQFMQLIHEEITVISIP